MWSERFNILSHFSAAELLILLAGKAFPITRSFRFQSLQDKENKLNILYSNGKLLSINRDEVKLNFRIGNTSLSIYLRLDGSDVWVFNQIIVNKGYGHLLSLYQDNFGNEAETIIDAGANVGLVTIFFKSKNPQARILAIEPDETNFEIALRNINTNSFHSVLLKCSALWPAKRPLQIVNDFRDKKEWSFRVEENALGRIDPITPEEAVTCMEGQVDIFKIDIEGGEARIFDKLTDLSWLRKVKVIAIEIHEEFGARDRIIDALSHYGFDLSYHGELTIGVNTILRKQLVPNKMSR